MKKNVIITIIVLLVLGFSYLLYKISPQPKPASDANFNLSGIQALTEPGQVRPEDHLLGNPEAKNTLVAFEDLQCPACANFEKTLKLVPTELQDTKVIWRHFPLFSLHKNAVVAAFAAEAVSAQNKFWEFANLLYENQAQWSDLTDPSGKFAEYAQTAGISNLQQFKDELAAQKYKSRVETDLREGLGLNIQGTPTIYFNGKQLELGDISSIKLQAEKLYR